MFKPVIVAAEGIRTAAPPLPEDVINNVFKVLHGYYGNLFLSKFSTGEVDADGGDKGVVSARKIWAFGLRDFDGPTIKSALRACQDRYQEYPPSMPQFAALCSANRPRQVYQAAARIGMSGELRSGYAREARAINARHAERAVTRATGYIAVEPGLDGLKQAIAGAIAAAGGNEAAALLRMDRLFPRTAA